MEEQRVSREDISVEADVARVKKLHSRRERGAEEEEVELTRFDGHLNIRQGGVHNATGSKALPVRIPPTSR